MVPYLHRRTIAANRREDSLKADQARKSGEMGTQPSTPDLLAGRPRSSTNPGQRLQAALKAHGHDPARWMA